MKGWHAGRGSDYNPERRLAAAVLWRAVQDARRGDADAAHFLAQEAEGWGEVLGLAVLWPLKSRGDAVGGPQGHATG